MSNKETVRPIGINLFEELTDAMVQHRVPIHCGSCGAPLMKFGEPLLRSMLIKVN
jgi:hypothetical protein